MTRVRVGSTGLEQTIVGAAASLLAMGNKRAVYDGTCLRRDAPVAQGGDTLDELANANLVAPDAIGPASRMAATYPYRVLMKTRIRMARGYLPPATRAAVSPAGRTDVR